MDKKLKYKKIIFIISTLISILPAILFLIFWDDISKASVINMGFKIIDKLNSKIHVFLFVLIIPLIFNTILNLGASKYYEKGMNKLFTQFPINGENKVKIGRLAAYSMCLITPIITNFIFIGIYFLRSF